MKSTSSDEDIITWTTSQVVFATIFVVCVFLAFWLLYRLRGVMFLFFVAIVIGTAIRPGVDWLRRRGISRRMGIILIYVLIAGLITGFLALTLPLIAEQTTQVSQNFSQYYNDIRGALVNSGNRLLQNIGWRIPPQLNFFVNRDPTAEEVVDQVTQTFFYTNLVIRGVLSIFAIFLLAYYWTQESNLIIRTLLRFVPPSRKDDVREFIDLAETKMGGYIRGQGILCLAVGLAAFISYGLIGLPFALVLSIIAGLMEMIPVFGPALGAIPALLVAVSVEPGKAIWVLVATGAIQLLENAWLVPRIMNNAMGVNPIIIMLSLVAFGSVFGFPGALLAIPLAALIQLIVDRIVRSSDEEKSRFQGDEIGVQSLIEEHQKLLQMVYAASGNGNSFSNEIPDAVQIEVNSIAREIDELLRQLKIEDEAV